MPRRVAKRSRFALAGSLTVAIFREPSLSVEGSKSSP
jgi:hypothetical protein